MMPFILLKAEMISLLAVIYSSLATKEVKMNNNNYQIRAYLNDMPEK